MGSSSSCKVWRCELSQETPFVLVYLKLGRFPAGVLDELFSETSMAVTE